MDDRSLYAFVREEGGLVGGTGAVDYWTGAATAADWTRGLGDAGRRGGMLDARRAYWVLTIFASVGRIDGGTHRP